MFPDNRNAEQELVGACGCPQFIDIAHSCGLRVVLRVVASGTQYMTVIARACGPRVVRVRIPPYPPRAPCARPLRADRARALVIGFGVVEKNPHPEIGGNGNFTGRPAPRKKIRAWLSPTRLMITSLVVALSDLTEANVSE